MSITRAFLRAGASCVVSTLWRVEDMESARLMRDFYGGIASGESVALAMSAAKNRQRSNGLPGRTWAAFQVYGDGSICPVTIESTNFRMGSNHASESR